MSARHTLSYRTWNRRVGSCLAFTYSARWSVRILSGVARLTPIPLPRLVRAHPEPGLLSSPGITRVPRSYEPLRRLPNAAPHGAVAPSPWPFDRPPVLQITACMSVPRPLPRRAGRPSRVGRSGRPQRPSSRVKRLGARIHPFEACSGFTRVAAHPLANPPKAGLCPRGFDGSVTLTIARVATKAYRHLLRPDSHRLR